MRESLTSASPRFLHPRNMGLLSSVNVDATPASVGLALVVTLVAALLSRVFYCQFLHPLAAFPGPWYATSFSLFGAIVSVRRQEPEFFTYLVRKYGSKFVACALLGRGYLCYTLTTIDYYDCALQPYYLKISNQTAS
jgi:hypothetical protein